MNDGPQVPEGGPKLETQLDRLTVNIDELEKEIGRLFIGLTGTNVPLWADKEGPAFPGATLDELLRDEVNRRLEQARAFLSALAGAIEDTIGQAKVCRVVLPPPPPTGEDLMRMAAASHGSL